MGVSVAVFVPALYETLAATGVAPSNKRTVVALIVAASIASLKVTVSAAVVATLFVPVVGVKPVTVGAVVSTGGVVLNTASTQ